MSEVNAKDLAVLAAALLAAQREVVATQVEKTGANDHFGSKYAELPNVIDAVVPVLNKHDIVVLQFPVATAKEGVLALNTTLMHKNGASISGVAEVPLAKEDPQAFGSAMTYCRRYALSSILGLKAVDDDAEGAMGRTRTFAPRTPPKREEPANRGTSFRRPATAPPRQRAGLFPKVGAKAGEEGGSGADS